jgi:hypothetical protein
MIEQLLTCLTDILMKHYPLQILHNSEELDAAYFTCRQVLFDLNNTIPDTIDSQKLALMVKDTGTMLEKISEDDFVEMKAMDGVLALTLKFLSLLVSSYIMSNVVPC